MAKKKKKHRKAPVKGPQREKMVENEAVHEALERLEKKYSETKLAQVQIANKSPAGGPAPGSTKETLADRNNYIVSLYAMGLSIRSIMNSVEKIAEARGWSPLRLEKSVQHIISQHYNNRKPEVEDMYEFKQGLREATMDQQETMIEKAIMFMKDKKQDSWKPFEYMDAMDKIYKWRQQLIDNKNWNESKMNNTVNVYNESTQILVYNRHDNVLRGKEDEALQEVITLLDECTSD